MFLYSEYSDSLVTKGFRLEYLSAYFGLGNLVVSSALTPRVQLIHDCLMNEPIYYTSHVLFHPYPKILSSD